MSFEKTKWIWQNGEFLPFDEAKIHATAFGLHYGTGVFEGIRCYDGNIFRLKEHMDRFYASAEVYKLKIDYSPGALNDAICETIRRNHFKNCYIRPTAYSDAGSLGIRATVPTGINILAWEWPSDFRDKQANGMRVTVSPYRKFHSSMIPTTAKATGNYLNSILAVREAAERGFDEAILLDVNGNLAEGAVENIFLIKDGKVLTNDQNSSILLGITRDSAIQIARNLGYDVEVRALKLHELLSADEVFLTGTAIEITPVREIDGKVVGNGARGPITEQIQKTFFDIAAGRKPEFQHWLYPVDQKFIASAG